MSRFKMNHIRSVPGEYDAEPSKYAVLIKNACVPRTRKPPIREPLKVYGEGGFS
jgi:hypothetical protein